MSSSNDVEEMKEDDWSVDADLVYLFAQIYAFISQSMQQLLEDTPISSDGLWFLSTVMMLGDNATPDQLALWMVRKPNTISGMTTRLAKKGFVEKKKMRGANNRVYLRIVLTEKGKEFLGKRLGTPRVPAAFSGFTLEQKKELRKTLFTTRKSIAQITNGYEEPPFPALGMPTPYWKMLNEEQSGKD
jgi:DNA-binding MarR family transcriptional regulator